MKKSAIRGGHIYLHLRKAERKIPSTLFNAICQREELIHMRAEGFDVISSKIRREIKARGYGNEPGKDGSHYFRHSNGDRLKREIIICRSQFANAA